MEKQLEKDDGTLIYSIIQSKAVVKASIYVVAFTVNVGDKG